MSSFAYSFSAVHLLKRISTPLRTLSPFPSWTRRFSVEPTPAKDGKRVAYESGASGSPLPLPNTGFGAKTALLGNFKSPTRSLGRQLSPKKKEILSVDPKKKEILDDVEPLILLSREIIHTDRYKDGERLSSEHEKAVIDKILSHHPNAEDKIGCGVDYLTVNRHRGFRNSRCMFVVRKDGTSTNFSFNVCIGAYLRQNYSSGADRFVKKCFLKCGPGKVMRNWARKY